MEIVEVVNDTPARALAGRHARRVPLAGRGGRAAAKARGGRVLGVITLVAAVGCVGANTRGSVAMKIDDRAAHVTLGSTEVKVGDRLELLENRCVAIGGGSGLGILSGRSSSTASCRKVSIGQAVVVRVLDEHYSEVLIEPGLSFEEGAIVERP